MNIPKQIKTAAKSLTDIYGDSFDYLGKYKGKDAYMFRFPDDVDTGFPFVFIHNDNDVTEVTGFDALKIVRLLVKD